MKKITVLLITALFCFSCNSYRGLSKQLDTTYDYDGKTLTMEGYIHLGRVPIHMINRGFMNVELKSSTWEFYTWLDILKNIPLHFGRVPNGIYVPQNFSIEQVELYDKNGARIDTSDRVRITATVEYHNRDPKKNNHYYDLKHVIVEKL